MRLCQDQVLLLLPEHGAARLDLAMLEHVAAVRVVNGKVESHGRTRRGRRERLIVVEFGAPERAKHGACALALTAVRQLRSWSCGRNRCLRYGVLVDCLFLAVP